MDEDFIKAQARKRQVSGLRKGSSSPLVLNQTDGEMGRTDQICADHAGVSLNKYRRVRDLIKRKAIPEQIELELMHGKPVNLRSFATKMKEKPDEPTELMIKEKKATTPDASLKELQQKVIELQEADRRMKAELEQKTAIQIKQAAEIKSLVTINNELEKMKANQETFLSAYKAEAELGIHKAKAAFDERYKAWPDAGEE